MSGLSIPKQLHSISEVHQKLEIKKAMLLEKAISSSNPSEVLAAYKALNIETKEESSKKSYVIDPFQFQSNFGYKDKPFSLSYSSLKRMSKVPVINAIIKTRKNQIADFAEPQADKYSTGFIIKKKSNYNNNKVGDSLTKQEEATIQYLTEFILNCGEKHDWEGDDFDSFIRKVIDDSLVYDQMTFEVIRNRKGIPTQFIATDASTFRIADSIDDEEYANRRNVGIANKKQQVKGYYPSYVQIVNNEVVAEFYPWELCFGLRKGRNSSLF